MKEYLKEYLITLRIEKNLSPKTCDAYKRDLIDYLSFINAEKITKITQMDIRNYIRELNNRKLAHSSISRKFSSIRSYHKFLSAEKLMNDNPTLILSGPKSPKKLPSVLS